MISRSTLDGRKVVGRQFARSTERLNGAVVLWTTYYAALVLIIFSSKLYGLLAAHEAWRETFFYTAAIAATSSWREFLLAAVLSTAMALLWHSARPKAQKLAVALVAGLAAALLGTINLINGELLPYFGAPLSLDLIHASNVFESEHGRSALLGWISPDAWSLAAAVLAAPLAAFVAVGQLWRVLGTRALLIATSGCTALIVVAGSISQAAPPVFTKSGTIYFLKSIRVSGAEILGDDPIQVEPLLSEHIEPAAVFRGTQAPGIRNVILIVLESVGASYLDIYGGIHNITPNLRSLAGQAVIVENAYAHAVSSTRSLGVLFSGRYPALSHHKLPESPPAAYQPLPLLLRSHGIRTAFFHSSDTRFDRTDQFLPRVGFDKVSDYRGRHCADPLLDDGWGALATTDRCTFQELQRWIGSNERPSFAVLWTFQSHYPYYSGKQAPPRVGPVPGGNKRTLEQKSRYLSAIAEADSLIGDLVQFVRAEGIEDETLLIITSDHGEVFGRRGTYGHRGLFEEVIRVPLILVSPRLVAGQLDRLSGHVDLAPTVADAFGLERPRSWDGRSLLDEHLETPIYFTNLWAEPSLGYRFRHMKVVHRLRTGDTEIFNLDTDPGESVNLADRLSPQRLRMERNRLFKWARSTNTSWEQAKRK